VCSSDLDHSIRHQRPIIPLLEGLGQLGAACTTTRGDGFAPVIIRGPLHSGTVTMEGQDSQPISALLIAAAFLEGITHVKVKNPGETPWILLTLDWFDRLGIRYENHNFTEYKVFGKTDYKGFHYTVPGDFSTAAFPIAAALVTDSELVLNNVDMDDSQGDKDLIYLLKKMGAKIDIDSVSKSLTVKKGGRLQGIEVDINAFIDAVPVLAAIACYADGETKITNAANARHKECDRLRAITLELQKMGGKVTELLDGLVITPAKLNGTTVFSHHDHRLAMSLMVAGLGATGETQITHTECVAKTFPDIAERFQALGAQIGIET
jgi:3-phosphoshikimate 1-carboxyvinyltransferase